MLGSNGAKFSIGDKVMHEGEPVEISGVDTASGEYQLSNGKTVEEDEIMPEVETM